MAVGSRGISNISEIVRNTVVELRSRGADPFIVPAMGSHGGGTPEGQEKILHGYGVDAECIGAPLVSSVESLTLGETEDGAPVLVDRAAFESDGIILINRIKPHTDFKGALGSGLLKMIAVGLGNVEGAATFHTWIRRLGHEKLIEARARALVDSGKLLGGIAVLENAYHETAHLELVPSRTIIDREKELLEIAKGYMPSLPVEELDILVVDRIGKNISGTGMDPNITGRWFRSSSTWQEKPEIKRIVVLSLTEESGGNAIGIGMADFCTDGVVDQLDAEITYLNVLTSQNVIAARLPIHFATTRETLSGAMKSLGNNCTADTVRMVRIKDTLNLTSLEASESLIPELRNHSRVRSVSAIEKMRFSSDDTLEPL